jgi:hypothetical protein
LFCMILKTIWERFSFLFLKFFSHSKSDQWDELKAFFSDSEQYNQLKNRIEPLDPNSEEWKYIQTYVSRTAFLFFFIIELISSLFWQMNLSSFVEDIGTIQSKVETSKFSTFSNSKGSFFFLFHSWVVIISFCYSIPPYIHIYILSLIIFVSCTMKRGRRGTIFEMEQTRISKTSLAWFQSGSFRCVSDERWISQRILWFPFSKCSH